MITYTVRCEDCGWTFESADWLEVVEAGEDHSHDSRGDGGGVREPRAPVTPRPSTTVIATTQPVTTTVTPPANIRLVQ